MAATRRGRRSGGGLGTARMAAALCAALLSACGAAPAAAPGDAAMDAEVRRQVAAGIRVQAAAMREGAFDVLPMTDRRGAPVRFDGKDVVCARLADRGEANDGARVLVIDLVQFVDSPLQGEWFDYLWRRSGC